MATQAERQKAYRERKRAAGKPARLYFVKDDQDRIIRAFLEKGVLPPSGPGMEMVEARDRLRAIRQRVEIAEERYPNKEDGSPPLTFWGIWQKIGEKMEKSGKENHREVQDLILLLARRAGIL